MARRGRDARFCVSTCAKEEICHLQRRLAQGAPLRLPRNMNSAAHPVEKRFANKNTKEHEEKHTRFFFVFLRVLIGMIFLASE